MLIVALMHIVRYLPTSLISLPSSSEMSLSRRSSSASMPTDSRTLFTSAADGEVFPPSPRRRYAARCFILDGATSQGSLVKAPESSNGTFPRTVKQLTLKLYEVNKRNNQFNRAAETESSSPSGVLVLESFNVCLANVGEFGVVRQRAKLPIPI